MKLRAWWSVAMLSILAGSLSACAEEDDTFTLYRSSVLDPQMRIHIATFDTTGNGRGYNAENCSIGAILFRGQDSVTVRYWCEKGRFRP